MKKIVYLIFALVMMLSCGENHSKFNLIPESNFHETISGKQVSLYNLKNKNDLVAQITNLGGRVVSLWTPDRNGQYGDIVLGFDTPSAYLNAGEKYFGTLVGRYGNRIAKGQFTLNGKVYKLATNNGNNHLHGGLKGFNDVVWDAKQIDGQTLELSYFSEDMEEGYPGNLKVKVVYQLTDDDELKIEYWATTDKPTPVNLTHHSFFNLKGAGNGSINEHILQINADNYTPVDEELIPYGKIAPVEGTPMDFRKPTMIGERVNRAFDQLIAGKGYDHNWVLNTGNDNLNFAAKVIEPISGRVIEVYTNEPGLQFYGGNFLDGSIKGKGGKAYHHRSAFCLETQHFPDSPNHDNFPSTILNPGDEYYSVCVYRFSTKK